MTGRDLLPAELIKIRTLPAIWIALAVACVANTLLGIVAATDAVRIAGPDGPAPITEHGTLMLAPVYAFAAVAVFAAGSEYRGGQLRISLLAAPDRDRLFAAKLAASAAVCLPTAVAALLPGHVARYAGAVADGRLGIGRVAVDLVALVAVYLLVGLIGHGFAIAARTVVTPLVALFGTPVLVAPILRAVLPEPVAFLPHEAALSLLGVPADPAALGRAAGLLVLTGWAVLFLGTAWALFTRRDG